MKRSLFTIALIVIVALGGILGYSAWKGRSLSANAYFESGKKYYDQKKYPEAIIQFLNAVRKDARHRDARYFLALSNEQQKDLRRAGATLLSLLEYYPEDTPAALELGKLYLASGDSEYFRKAQELAHKILSREPQNVQALLLSGHASAALQDYPTASEVFQKAATIDPQNVEALVSLGSIDAIQKNNGEAEQTLLKARQIDPKNPSAITSLTSYYRIADEPKKAETVLKDALAIAPRDEKLYLQTVDLYMKAGRFDDAEKTLREMQAKKPDDPRAALILVDFLDDRNRSADAEKLLLETKQKFPANVDVAVTIATRFLQSEPDRARPEIDLILKAQPAHPAGHILLGELQFNTGHYDDAEATLGKDPAINSPFPQPHFFLGNIALKKGQVDQAIDHYQKSLKVNGTYIPARVALGQLLLEKGKITDAREEARMALQVRPGYLSARLLQIEVDRTENRTSAVEQELAALTKDEPDNPTVYRQMALYNESRGRAAEAEKDFTRVLELSPNSQGAFADLTNFYIRQKQTERAIQKINTIPEGKRQAFHYDLMGIAYSTAGKFPDAEKAYKKALEIDPSHTVADLYLFTDYMRNGRTDEALQRLDDILKKNPKDSRTLVLKASIYENRGKTEEARQMYVEALQIDPNYEVAANNLAVILTEEGRDLQAALQYAQIARKKLPESPNTADTLGWVYYKLGNYVLAREQALFAVSKQPDNGSFLYHLAMSYKGNYQLHDAIQTLKKATLVSTDFKEKPLAQTALKNLAK